MVSVSTIIRPLQILAVALGLAASLMVVTPQPAEARFCVSSVCGWIGAWYPMGACIDTFDLQCAAVMPLPR